MIMIMIMTIMIMTMTNNLQQKCEASSLAEHVLPVRTNRLPSILDRGKVHKMARPVHLMIELLGVTQSQLVSHVRVVAHSHEVVVPRALSGNHEEAKEPIRQEHLDFLIVGGKVTLGVVALVRVGSTPLKTRWGQLVCCE